MVVKGQNNNKGMMQKVQFRAGEMRVYFIRRETKPALLRFLSAKQGHEGDSDSVSGILL
jgi:hypothetical protein